MKQLKALPLAGHALPARQPCSSAISIPNVGVTISHSNRNVRIRDLNHVYEDILVQGDDMDKFLSALKHATVMMPDLPVKDALVVVTAPFVGNKWS